MGVFPFNFYREERIVLSDFATSQFTGVHEMKTCLKVDINIRSMGMCSFKMTCKSI